MKWENKTKQTHAHTHAYENKHVPSKTITKRQWAMLMPYKVCVSETTPPFVPYSYTRIHTYNNFFRACVNIHVQNVYLYLVDNCDWFTHHNRNAKTVLSFSRLNRPAIAAASSSSSCAFFYALVCASFSFSLIACVCVFIYISRFVVTRLQRHLFTNIYNAWIANFELNYKQKA